MIGAYVIGITEKQSSKGERGPLRACDPVYHLIGRSAENGGWMPQRELSDDSWERRSVGCKNGFSLSGRWDGVF